MTFAPRISPANRIREQLDLPELMKTYSTVVTLESEAEFGSIPRGYLYTFSSQNLHEFIAEIVQHTYDETFAMLKRKIEQEEK